ncbi:hypothetical protein N7499_006715 [Penicillium canescens]|nr:hypothetical protein N7499_006715 [Penicillium canescens]
MSRSFMLSAPHGVASIKLARGSVRRFNRHPALCFGRSPATAPNQTKSKQDYQITIPDDLYAIYIPKTDLRFYQRLAHFIANSPNPAFNLSSTNLPRPISPPCGGKRYSQRPAS